MCALPLLYLFCVFIWALNLASKWKKSTRFSLSLYPRLSLRNAPLYQRKKPILFITCRLAVNVPCLVVLLILNFKPSGSIWLNFHTIKVLTDRTTFLGPVQTWQKRAILLDGPCVPVIVWIFFTFSVFSLFFVGKRKKRKIEVGRRHTHTDTHTHTVRRKKGAKKEGQKSIGNYKNELHN